MKLSNHTTSVLKNFATINQNLVIKEGNEMSTMSAMKNIIARATVEETFPKEIAIYDLNEFLGALSLFSEPILDFSDSFVTITEENKPSTKMKYFYSDPSVVTSPSKMINMPSNEVKFTMSNDDLSKLKRAASAIGAPDMVLEKNGAGSSLTVKDKKNDTANNYSLDVDVEGQGDYNFYFKVENLKLMPLTYDVKVSSKNISHFKSQTSNAVEYWIALEPESSYSE